jgi:uncharacterized protein (TIGR02099 family)
VIRILTIVARRLAAFAAVLVILLAIAVGAFRLLLPQLPAYEGQIKSWAEQALGLPVDFARLDARWGLQGPELTFFDARVGGTPGSPLLAAQRASVGVGLLSLITRRELLVDRLTLSGTDVLLERTAEGGFAIQGQTLAADGRLSGLALERVPSFQVIVQDSRVQFIDHARGSQVWQLTDAEFSLQRNSDRVLALAQAVLPPALGTMVNLSAEVDLDSSMANVGALTMGRWRVVAELEDFDFAGWSTLLPAQPGFVPDRGHGDLSLWVEFLERSAVKGTLQLALADVSLPGQRLAATEAEPYDNISLVAEWQHETDGWRIGLTNMVISRSGRRWPPSDADVRLRTDQDVVYQLALKVGFARLQDLQPVMELLPDAKLAALWQAMEPDGDVRNLNLVADRVGDGPWNYALEANLQAVGIAPYEQWPGVRGVTGDVRADNASGSVDLASKALELNYPAIFGGPLPIASLSGILVWRQGRGGLRLVGDDVAIDSPDFSVRSSLELTLPADGSSPVLEIDAGAVGVNALAAKRYLPVGKMHPKLVSWLTDSILGGEIPRARLSFFGPVRAFPFDNGEGQFRVSGRLENGRLRFAPGWMTAENISADVEFANAGLDGQVSSARILDHVTTDARVRFEDLRTGVMTVIGETRGPLQGVLDFLKAAPVTAGRMGGRLGTLSAPSGTGRVALDMRLPLKRLADYQLTGTLTMVDGELALEGLPARFSKLNGRLRLEQTEVSGQDIAGELLGSPLVATVTPLRTEGYRSQVSWYGPVQAQAFTPWLSADLAGRLSGHTEWRVDVLLPDVDKATASNLPTRIKIASDLQGIGVALPAPLGKTPEQPLSLVADLGLSASGALLAGYLGPANQFLAEFNIDEAGTVLRRANLRFGGSPAALPPDGIFLDGEIDALVADEWITVFAEQRSAVAGLDLAAAADIYVSDLRAFGQNLGTTHLVAVRRDADWRVDMDSEPVLGSLVVPIALAERPQLILDMQRLHLQTGDGEALSVDPRKLPGAVVVARDFSLGERKLGELNADITADELGLNMQSFATDAGSYGIVGSGRWIARDDGQSTQIAATLNTTDVAASLDGLGYMQGMFDGARGQLTADLSWQGAPTADWTRTAAGEVSLSIDDGSVYAIEPGAGRVVGLMSIAALPRRLALDFRDVFQKGLRFDKVRGSFLLIDGNAFTNNLKLEGPVAEIGIVGRTGLKDRDYRQQAVVSAETGKMLPAVGGILAGPGVGAALLLFTQIFKEPLKGMGRASYCVSGSWEEPSVERLTPAQLADGTLCIDLPPESANAMAADVVAEDEAG